MGRLRVNGHAGAPAQIERDHAERPDDEQDCGRVRPHGCAVPLRAGHAVAPRAGR